MEVQLSDILPEWLAKTLESATGETNPLRVVSKLCAMRYAWMASAILSALIMSGAASNVRLEIAPSECLIESCELIEKRDSDGSRVYAVFRYVDKDGNRNVTCMVIEDTGEQARARPCSDRELSEFVPRGVEGGIVL